MKIFDLMRRGWVRHKKVTEGEIVLIPTEDGGITFEVEPEKREGDGRIVDGRLITIREPYSVAAEQYRILCTRISQLLQDKSSYMLAITSSVKAEGKSFTSLNLAISMARDFDEKVFLIEGDLKNPTLHESLKRPPGFGLSDVLENRIDLETASIRLFEGKLTVLLAGKAVGNPAKLISSPKMHEMLNSARSYSKYVIIDTPPVIPLADINIYSKLVDGILLIIKAGKTPKSIVKRALATMPAEKVIGVVLNEVEPNYSKYYYTARYSY